MVIEEITLKELKQIILSDILSLRLNKTNYSKLATLIIGKRGTGKTESIRSLVKELNAGFVEERLSLRDPQDLTGAMIPKIDNENDPYMVELKSELIRRIEKEKENHDIVIVFFDEITQVHPATQKILMQIITERQISQYKIPDGVYFLLAGNYLDEASFGEILESPVADRMYIYYIKPEINTFMKWAEENNVNPILLSYLKFNQDIFLQEIEYGDVKRYISPRMITETSKRLNSRLQLKDQLLKELSFHFPDENIEDLFLNEIRLILISAFGLIGKDIFCYFSKMYEMTENILNKIKAISINKLYNKLVNQDNYRILDDNTIETVSEIDEIYILTSILIKIINNNPIGDNFKYFLALSEIFNYYKDKKQNQVIAELIITSMTHSYRKIISTFRRSKNKENFTAQQLNEISTTIMNNEIFAQIADEFYRNVDKFNFNKTIENTPLNNFIKTFENDNDPKFYLTLRTILEILKKSPKINELRKTHTSLIDYFKNNLKFVNDGKWQT